jgi:hypothetical protein
MAEFQQGEQDEEGEDESDGEEDERERELGGPGDIVVLEDQQDAVHASTSDSDSQPHGDIRINIPARARVRTESELSASVGASGSEATPKGTIVRRRLNSGGSEAVDTPATGVSSSRSRQHSDGSSSRRRGRTHSRGDHQDKSGGGGSTSESRRRSVSGEAGKARGKSDAADAGTNKNNGQLMTEEEHEVGAVNSSIYWWYFQSGGIWNIAVMFAFMSVLTVVGVYSNFWLVRWCSKSEQARHDGNPFSITENLEYLGHYAWLSFSVVLGAFVRAYFTVLRHGLKASKVMHDSLLSAALSASIAFYDVTPVGRVLNRFSGDLLSVDESLALNYCFYFGVMFILIGAFGLIAVTTSGTFLIILMPLMLIYYRVQLYYRATYTQLKRLENVSRSPVVTEFTEALQGTTSIRAFGEEEQFIKAMEKGTDTNLISSQLVQVSGFWLSIRLDVLGSAISCFIGGLAIGAAGFIPAGYVAMGLANALLVPGLLKTAVLQSTFIEAMMSSAERIKHYVDTIKPEESPNTEFITPPKETGLSRPPSNLTISSWATATDHWF